MHLQVLSSGSEGNATLVRAGDVHLLVDAGLPLAELEERLERARVAPRRIDHVALSHGHLDHARSSGALGRRAGARVLCCERLMSNASVRRARRLAALVPGREHRLEPARGQRGLFDADDALRLRAVPIPHDAQPTVAFVLEHEDARGTRRAVVVTDMGEPCRRAAAALGGAHVLVLEFNHDARMLREGPYPFRLKRRVGGPRGHLSNADACTMLRWLAGPELHTLVLAHLSRTNNRPEIAREAARTTLDELGLGAVAVVTAEQHEIGANLAV
jgi:phosphoribosyl 1,2-cyclic phosphodiesterase